MLPNNASVHDHLLFLPPFPPSVHPTSILCATPPINAILDETLVTDKTGRRRDRRVSCSQFHELSISYPDNLRRRWKGNLALQAARRYHSAGLRGIEDEGHLRSLPATPLRR